MPVLVVSRAAEVVADSEKVVGRTVSSTRLEVVPVVIGWGVVGPVVAAGEGPLSLRAGL